MTAARLAWRALLLTLAVAATGLAVLVATPSAPAQAADLSDFDPGNIISDSVFYDEDTMTAAQVQSFLNTKGAACTGSSTSFCLKSYRQTTADKPADSRCTGAYTGRSSETAATIIAKVAQACGINPQVLLVTLQKEQGLVTSTTGKTAATYRKAMGFGCPDTAPCDAQYYGFFNQVYRAGWQFNNYRINANSYSHRAGMTNNVRFHPNAGCGTSPVYIRNQATAGLYNYTPYQPNRAALAAGYGTGDSCSAYGNRNFWNYFTDWFGSTNQRPPVGRIDAVATSAGQITVSGWTFDPDVDDSLRVHVYVDGKVVKGATADLTRTDVARAYGVGDAHGYRVTVPATDGRRTVCVYAMDANSGPTNPKIGCKTVTVTNTRPTGALDAVTNAGGLVTVKGWALDPDTSASIRVHVYVDGKVVKGISASTTRNDISRRFGLGAQHGFSTTVTPGTGAHQVCAYAIDATGGGSRKIGCKTVTVTNAAPKGRIDTLRAEPGAMVVSGWTFDPDTTASIRVHVYVDGRIYQSALASRPRPDIGRVYGKGDEHGFALTIPAATGRHEVCVYGINAIPGKNTSLGCRTTDVTNAAPVGDLSGSVEGTTLRADGWVLDPDADVPLTARMRVNGSVVASTTASTPRAGVGAPFGQSDERGFSFDLAGAVVGDHTVCIDAADASTRAFTQVRCTTLTVNGLPTGRLDTAVASEGRIKVTGWAADPNTPDPIRVHVYVDGRSTKGVTADLVRKDGRWGFNTSFPVAAGPHTVCVYAIDVQGERNPSIGCRDVTVG
ncbi:hypothetical protein [Cellulomonas oligotrophica]|uniref:Bacterial Ig-like domain-containing protein n=1 Tax=Cellulomonas oligotrophica TaxID=931536 RepID=A0A7Y9FD77_9CELL|nr:hypothetical protein [Cellulomonas oligotrophica]NYD85223.1 hypothetical protein [Cellulomonas oligotrophica]GIG33341.1 hypothetical protein Col01nite_25000 [Cellulomonas oligotrophica]